MAYPFFEKSASSSTPGYAAFNRHQQKTSYNSGYGYSQFCSLYRAWKGELAPTMRQTYVAGEKMFVNYAGATMEVINGLAGEIRTAQIFVSTLGASSYTYAEATWTQALPNWIGSHCRAFSYFGGLQAQDVPDNLKTGVAKATSIIPRSTAPMPTWWLLQYRDHTGAAAQAA